MLKAVGRLLALFTVPLLTTLSAKNVLIFPYNPTSTNIAVYNGDPLSASPVSTWSVAPGANFVASNTTGTKYYFGTGLAATASVYVVDSSNGNTIKHLDFTGALTYMDLAPDGKRLIVFAGGLHVIDVSTDLEITPLIPDIGPAIQNGIAATPDGTRVLALVSLGNTGGRLYAIDLATNTVVGASVAIPSDVKAVSVSPGGLAYVSAAGAVYEVNPQTMTILNTFNVTGAPSTVVFTPDGKLGVAANLTQSGPGLYVLDLTTKILKTSSSAQYSFDPIIPVGNTRAIGFSTALQTIFDIPLNNPAAATVPTWGNLNFNGSVRGIVASDEVPAKYLYVLQLGVMTRVDLAAGTVTQTSVTIPQAYRMGVAGAVSANSASQLLSYNDAQTLAVGVAPLPLVGRALDSSGRPVGGATISFTTNSPTVAIASQNAVTNSAGYAQTTVTVPAVAGTYTISAQVGSSVRTYTIIVGTTTGGGGGGGGGSTAGLSIVSGQGQVLLQFHNTAENGPDGNPAYEPLIVVLRDSSGNPIPGVNLTWTVRQGSGNISLVSTTTDGNGQALNQFTSGPVSVAGSISPVIVDVTDGNGNTVSFNLTVVGPPPGNPQGQGGVNANILQPVNYSLSGGAGSTLTGGLKLLITTNWGAPLQNVALKLVTPGDPTQVASASCAGGYALSDVNGIATCDVVFGPKPGDTQAIVKFGGAYSYSNFAVHVDVGAPTVIVPLTPTTLRGNPGQTLAANALGVEVRDGGGNIITNVPLTWTVVTPGTITLTNAFSRTNSSGQGFATPTLGSIPGAAQVTVTAGTVSFTFTINVDVQLGGLTYVSGNNQSALIGTGFTNPLVVNVTDASKKPVQNITINWAITTGVGSLNANSSSTDASGNASINAFAGSGTGSIVVTASTPSLPNVSVTFNLTVIPPGPVFTASNVVNTVSLQPGVTPGGLATITGQNLAANLNGSVVANNGLPGSWPLTLNGVTVKFGIYSAPIQSVNNINGVQSVVVQVPFELPVGTTTVTITLSGGTGSASGVQVKPVQPGLFESVDSNGKHFAVLSRPDGSLVTSANPAVHGEILQMYATGLGQTSPVTGTNEVGIPNQAVVSSLIAGVAGGGTTITNTAYATGAIGVYIISFQLPPETAPGTNVPVSIAAQNPDGSYAYSNTSVIAAVK